MLLWLDRHELCNVVPFVLEFNSPVSSIPCMHTHLIILTGFRTVSYKCESPVSFKFYSSFHRTKQNTQEEAKEVTSFSVIIEL